MRLASIALGGFAALAVGIATLQDHDETEEATPAPASYSAASPVPANQPALYDRALELAQQYGTVCQTPAGSVCTVPPQAVNSLCQCGGSQGLIVR